MLSESVTIVDVNDQVVGKAPRLQVREKGLIHRVSYILVFNSSGKLLLQKRTKTKDLFARFYDAAAGGVVQFNESYEVSALRELQEELDVKGVVLQFHFDHYFDDGHNRYWGRVFTCQHDGPFVLQASEVQSAEFVNVEQILANEFKPLTPDTAEVLQRWFDM